MAAKCMSCGKCGMSCEQIVHQVNELIHPPVPAGMLTLASHMNHIPVTDAVVIACYFLSMLLMGILLGRKNKSAVQFTTASGKIPGWAIGMSLFSTFLSSNTFIGNPGKAFGSNWNSFVFTLTLPIAAIIGVK